MDPEDMEPEVALTQQTPIDYALITVLCAGVTRGRVALPTGSSEFRDRISEKQGKAETCVQRTAELHKR